MDMKGLGNHLVSVHMDTPPSTKKVPLVFPGWVVFAEEGQESNIFYSCQLLADRTGVLHVCQFCA